jgi:hypothetical protein
MQDNASAATVENVEWPEMYDGKFGRPITVLMSGSNCDGVRP